GWRGAGELDRTADGRAAGRGRGCGRSSGRGCRRLRRRCAPLLLTTTASDQHESRAADRVSHYASELEPPTRGSRRCALITRTIPRPAVSRPATIGWTYTRVGVGTSSSTAYQELTAPRTSS